MKKETLQNIVYSPLHLWFKLHAILPMRILYILSDILYFPLYHIVHYRKKLVSENLRKAFPDKTDKELKQLEQKFYHHFCDYIVETIKLMHISDEEMRRRMKFEQVEIIDRLFAENRSIIILLGHFGNWEWVPSVTLWTHTPDVMFAQIYRPLKNKWFDRFFL
jgi:Kdo2-lipid IVA lauroyltransferase/acyltransferase